MHQARRGARSAREAGRRQGGVAEPHPHLLHGQAEPFGRSHRQQRRDAVADLVMGAPYLRRSVRRETQPHRRRGDLHRPHRGGAAQPDPPRPLPDRAGRDRPPLPAEGGGARIEAGHQRPARERFARDRVLGGVVAAAQFDRIEAEPARHLVDRALQGEQVGHLRRRAHRAGRVAVDPHGALARADRGAGIEARRHVGALHREGIEARGDDIRFVDEAREPPIAVGGQPDVVARLRAVIGDREALPPRRHQRDRAPEALGGEGDQGGVLREGELRAEMPADRPGDDPHLGRIEAELGREPVLDRADVAARLVHGEVVAVPGTAGGEQLDRVVMLHRRLVARLHPRPGDTPGCVGVAPRDVLVMGLEIGEPHDLGARIVEGRGGGLGRVGRANQIGGPGRRLLGAGHDERHDLALIGDAVRAERQVRRIGVAARHQVAYRRDRAGKVAISEDRQEVRHCAGRVQVEVTDAPARDGAGDEGGVGAVARARAVLAPVGGVAHCARHLGAPLDPDMGVPEDAARCRVGLFHRNRLPASETRPAEPARQGECLSIEGQRRPGLSVSAPASKRRSLAARGVVERRLGRSGSAADADALHEMTVFRPPSPRLLDRASGQGAEPVRAGHDLARRRGVRGRHGRLRPAPRSRPGRMGRRLRRRGRAQKDQSGQDRS